MSILLRPHLVSPAPVTTVHEIVMLSIIRITRMCPSQKCQLQFVGDLAELVVFISPCHTVPRSVIQVHYFRLELNNSLVERCTVVFEIDTKRIKLLTSHDWLGNKLGQPRAPFCEGWEFILYDREHVSKLDLVIPASAK